MLVVKIDAEKDKETLQKVTELLAEFDILSVSWEDEPKAQNVEVDLRSGVTGADLGKTLSAAVDRHNRGR